MTCRKRPRLDFQQSSPVDIISELIDRQLEDIAGDIISNLSDMDMANAVAANPKWSAIATGRARLERLFSKNKGKTVHLKMLYRKEELLAQKTQDSADARTLFMRACAKYSDVMRKFRVKSKEKQHQRDFRIALPVECGIHSLGEGSLRWISMNDEFIVTVFIDYERRGFCFIQVFDRWTFQLVNCLTGKCINFEDFDYVLPRLVKNGVNALFIEDDLSDDYSRATLLHLTTGKVHTLTCSGFICQTFCIAKLVFLFWMTHEDARQSENDVRAGEEVDMFATVYKEHAEPGSGFDCLVDGEFLQGFGIIWIIPSADDVDCFAITNSYTPYPALFQLRSKEDFSLLRTVTDMGSPFFPSYNSFMFDKCFAFVFKRKEDKFIDVVSLDARDWRTVYRFAVPDELPRASHEYSRPSKIFTVGRFLVLYTERDDYWNSKAGAAIWKLPSDFIETCHRHVKEGTVGVTSKCDQLVVGKNAGLFEEGGHHFRFDRFGIVSCSVTWEHTGRLYGPVVHVAMLNSILSD